MENNTNAHLLVTFKSVNDGQWDGRPFGHVELVTKAGRIVEVKSVMYKEEAEAFATELGADFVEL